MGSLSKFFADHSDLLAEAFDLDAESNLVEKDHISAAAVESLVHDLLVNEMQDILTELIIPAPRDNRGYQRMGGGTQASNPDQGQWSELPADFVAARRAATGEGPPPGAGGAAGRTGGGAGGAGQPMQAGVGGSIPTQVVSILKGRGWSDAAIKGALANAMTEGGLSEPWKKSGGNENSFGMWQFNRNGELPGYYAWAKQNGIDNPDGHVAGQTNYMASRVESMIPGYAKHTDDRAATDDFHIKFERPADKTPGSRYQWLGAAQQHYDSALKNIAAGNPTGQTAATGSGNSQGQFHPGGSMTPHGYYGADRPAYTGHSGAVGSHIHAGVDLGGAAGDSVRATQGGTVLPSSGPHSGYGNTVDILLPDGKFERHAHLANPTVKPGDQIPAGHTVGSIGPEGHNHYELHTHYDYQNGGNNYGRNTTVDPAPYLTSLNTPKSQPSSTQMAQSAKPATPAPNDDIAKIVAPKIATAQPTSAPTAPKTPPPNLQASADDIAKIVAPQQPAAAPPPPVTAPAPPPKSAVPPPTDDIAKIVAPQVPPAIAAVVPPVTPPAKLVSWAVPSTRGRLGIQLLRS